MKQIPVECYSRVVGYFQPTMQWNKGKKEEFAERKTYSLDKIREGITHEQDKCKQM